MIPIKINWDSCNQHFQQIIRVCVRQGCQCQTFHCLQCIQELKKVGKKQEPQQQEEEHNFIQFQSFLEIINQLKAQHSAIGDRITAVKGKLQDIISQIDDYLESNVQEKDYFTQVFDFKRLEKFAQSLRDRFQQFELVRNMDQIVFLTANRLSQEASGLKKLYNENIFTCIGKIFNYYQSLSAESGDQLFTEATANTMLHTNYVSAASISNDGRFVASAGCLKDDIKIWETSQVQQRLLKAIPYSSHLQLYIWTVSFSSDNKLLATAGRDDFDVKVWALQGQSVNPILNFKGHSQSILRSFFCYNDAILATCSADKTLRLWDIKKATEAYIHKDSAYIYGLAISKSHKFMAILTQRGHAKVFSINKQNFDPTQIQKICHWHAHLHQGCGIDFQDDDRLILTTGLEDQSVKIWIWTRIRDTWGPKLIRSLSGHTGWVITGKFIPQSQLAISYASDSNLKIWHICTGCQVQELYITGGIEYTKEDKSTLYILSVDFDEQINYIVTGAQSVSPCLYQRIQRI